MPGKVHPTDRIIKVVQIQTGAGKVKELCEDQNLEEKEQKEGLEESLHPETGYDSSSSSSSSSTNISLNSDSEDSEGQNITELDQTSHGLKRKSAPICEPQAKKEKTYNFNIID